MLLRLAVVLGTAQLCASPLAAGTAEELVRLLRIDEVMLVMRNEGLDYGLDLEAELFPAEGGERWQGVVGRIYDAEAMSRQFAAVFGPEMEADPQALDATLDFFGSERGQRIVELEIAARRALLDESVEEAAEVRVDEMRRSDDPRLVLINRYAEINDLIEQNVAGALNSNLAFYSGMSAGGAFEGGLTESQILADVWSQEAEIRGEAEKWLFPFLALAYDPLPDEDLKAYVAYSETPAGQALNAAMFAGFDSLFRSISADLGQAAAQMLSGEDL